MESSNNKPNSFTIYKSAKGGLGEHLGKTGRLVLGVALGSVLFMILELGLLILVSKLIVYLIISTLVFHYSTKQGLQVKHELGTFSMATRFREWDCRIDELQFREYTPPSGSRMIQVERKSGKKDVIWESAFTDYDRFRTELIAMNLLENKESN